MPLARYPIINSGKIAFGTNSFNGVIFVDLKMLSDTIRVYNVHFKSYNLQEIKSLDNYYFRIKRALIERANQASQVLAHIDNCKYPVIILGDFNEPPYSYVYNFFLPKNLAILLIVFLISCLEQS